MRADIHPKYDTVTVHCSCGNTFETRSTADDLRVELCSECHPFYTGKQKLVDTGGRIDRFERRYGRRKKGAGQAEEPTPAAEPSTADEPTAVAEATTPDEPTPAAEATTPDEPTAAAEATTADEPETAETDTTPGE